MNETEPTGGNGHATHETTPSEEAKQETKEQDKTQAELVAEVLPDAPAPEESRGRGRQRKLKISNKSSTEIAVMVPMPSCNFKTSPPPTLETNTKANLEFDSASVHPTDETAPELNTNAASVAQASDNKPNLELSSTSSQFSNPPEFSNPEGGDPNSKPSPATTTAALTTVSSPPDAKFEEDQTTNAPRDIVLRNIAGPGALANKILEVDGRIKNRPHGNAWKEFRCYRNNQDMGSLWEVRQAWFVKVTK
jgi:hypothetical protein